MPNAPIHAHTCCRCAPVSAVRRTIEWENRVLAKDVVHVRGLCRSIRGRGKPYNFEREPDQAKRKQLRKVQFGNERKFLKIRYLFSRLWMWFSFSRVFSPNDKFSVCPFLSSPLVSGVLLISFHFGCLPFDRLHSTHVCFWKIFSTFFALAQWKEASQQWKCFVELSLRVVTNRCRHYVSQDPKQTIYENCSSLYK